MDILRASSTQRWLIEGSSWKNSLAREKRMAILSRAIFFAWGGGDRIAMSVGSPALSPSTFTPGRYRRWSRNAGIRSWRGRFPLLMLDDDIPAVCNQSAFAEKANGQGKTPVLFCKDALCKGVFIITFQNRHTCLEDNRT